jgi:hypothetical protein
LTRGKIKKGARWRRGSATHVRAPTRRDAGEVGVGVSVGVRISVRIGVGIGISIGISVGIGVGISIPVCIRGRVIGLNGAVIRLGKVVLGEQHAPRIQQRQAHDSL